MHGRLQRSALELERLHRGGGAAASLASGGGGQLPRSRSIAAHILPSRSPDTSPVSLRLLLLRGCRSGSKGLRRLPLVRQDASIAPQRIHPATRRRAPLSRHCRFRAPLPSRAAAQRLGQASTVGQQPVERSWPLRHPNPVRPGGRRRRLPLALLPARHTSPPGPCPAMPLHPEVSCALQYWRAEPRRGTECTCGCRGAAPHTSRRRPAATSLSSRCQVGGGGCPDWSSWVGQGCYCEQLTLLPASCCRRAAAAPRHARHRRLSAAVCVRGSGGGVCGGAAGGERGGDHGEGGPHELEYDQGEAGREREACWVGAAGGAREAQVWAAGWPTRAWRRAQAAAAAPVDCRPAAACGLWPGPPRCHPSPGTYAHPPPRSPARYHPLRCRSPRTS